MLSLSNPPTAIFACNGLMMVGALEVIAARGLKILGKLPSSAMTIFHWPTSSTRRSPLVRQPAYEVGKYAAELLLKRIEDPERPATKLKLMPELVVRKSC